MAEQLSFGIDIGGSGIKGAPVDLHAGSLASPRVRLETPQPATPQAVSGIVAEIVRRFDWTGPLGVTVPAVVKHGVVMTAANIDPAWIGTDAASLFATSTGRPVTVINDADAAGLAEMRFGAGRDQPGVVLMITLGTGIGFAIFNDGVLLPNTELGHIEIDGVDAESRASASAREEHDESWKKWSVRVDQYLAAIEALLWPDLIIIGGGVSKRADKFFRYLHTRARLVPAALQNDAGIIGAALLGASADVNQRRGPAPR